MGKLLTVNSGYSAVLLPSQYGLRNYNPGDTVLVTDAEYAGFTTATTQAVTVTTSGLVDPPRKGTDVFAEPTNSVVAVAAGALVIPGVNIVTGPAGGVTYPATGFLQVAYDNPSVIPAIIGAKPGSQSTVEVYHVQGAVVSVAPTAKSWFNVRSDVVSTTSGSPTVLDANAVLGDTGRPVSGTGIPATSFIQNVVPGVSFQISSTQATYTAANASATGTPTIVVGATTRWGSGTVPTFTASVGAVDYFQFVTYDGGLTWTNLVTVKGLA